jgi:hypothetical protein
MNRLAWIMKIAERILLNQREIVSLSWANLEIGGAVGNVVTAGGPDSAGENLCLRTHLGIRPRLLLDLLA